MNIFEDNKKFWQHVKPLFSNKLDVSQKNIIIVEKDTIISNNTEVAEKLNYFFIEAVENLEIEPFVPHNGNRIYTESIHEIVKKYETHPSILKIKKHVCVDSKFTFSDTTQNNLKDDICKLDPKKASTENDIPTKILIDSSDIVGEHLSNIYNISKKDAIYRLSLKLADVTPIHKKEEQTLLKNYRPVSLIPIVSKLFERDMYSTTIY